MIEKVNKCWAESYCKAFNEERSNCTNVCKGYAALNLLYKHSRIPKRYQYDHEMILKANILQTEHDLEMFRQLANWKKHVKDRIDKGDGLFIHSPNKGNGKTTWACKIAAEYFKQTALKTDPTKTKVLFLNVPDFFFRLRENMFRKEKDLDFEWMLEQISVADLVIWDDIGIEKPTDFVKEVLYRYINERYNNMKAQIFTSNKSVGQLAEDLSPQIADRIFDCARIIEFKDGSKRGAANE